VGRMEGSGGVVGEYGEEVRNENGMWLREVLEGNECVALNGRKEGEVEWTFEVQAKAGVRRSVVDYVCVSAGMKREVVGFGVAKELDVGGDGHAPVWVEMVWARHRKVRKKEVERWRIDVAGLKDEEKRDELQRRCEEVLGEWADEEVTGGGVGWVAWKDRFMVSVRRCWVRRRYGREMGRRGRCGVRW
jgi:hypothetical protein